MCLVVECCAHLINIKNFWLLWLTVFMKQFDCGEWIMDSPYGHVWSNLYFMAHCLCSRLRLKCDGTCAETRFHLSAKRTSPFKSVGASVQSTTRSWLCGSAVVMLDTPSSEVVWRVLFTHSIRQFPLHFPSHASPCAITFQLESTCDKVNFDFTTCMGGSQWIVQITACHRIMLTLCYWLKPTVLWIVIYSQQWKRCA